MNALTIRLAEPTDLASVMMFDQLPGDRINEIMDRRMLVAEAEDVITAYLAWHIGGCIGNDYINKLVVRPECRGKGFARQLIAQLGDYLKGRVFISAGSKNLPALTLFVETGWTEAGQLGGLHENGETEVFYYKDYAPGTHA